MRYVSKLIISIAACEVIGVAGEVLFSASPEGWYAALDKPVCAPPPGLLSPAWFILFLLTGIAASIIWHKGLHIGPVRTALWFFLTALILNAAWFVLFFAFNFIFYAMIAIAVLWIIALIATIKFYNFSIGGGSLMIPYLLWTAYIALFNIYLVLLNDRLIPQLFGGSSGPLFG